MTEHHGESLIDKVKDALGMGHREETHPEDMHEHTPGAGVVEGTDSGDELAATRNRPAGPDFGAEEPVERDLGMTGTADADTGVGYGTDRETVSDTGAAEPGTAAGESEWTRGEAASGESPVDTDEDVETRRDPF